MKKIVAGFAGAIFTLTIGTQLTTWLGSQHGIYTGAWTTNLLGGNESDAVTQMALPLFLLIISSICGFAAGLLIYKLAVK